MPPVVSEPVEENEVGLQKFLSLNGEMFLTSCIILTCVGHFLFVQNEGGLEPIASLLIHKKVEVSMCEGFHVVPSAYL